MVVIFKTPRSFFNTLFSIDFLFKNLVLGAPKLMFLKQFLSKNDTPQNLVFLTLKRLSRETWPDKNGKRRFMYVVVRIDAFLYARVRIKNK